VRIGSGPRTALAVAIALFLPFAAQAGDILRGGARAGSRQGSAAPASPNPAVVEQARVNARDALARTTRTIQAMQAMQKTAREIALRGANNLGANPNRPGVQLPNVPDGLAIGGLQVAPGAAAGSALWQGAALPKQTTAGDRTSVVVAQNQQQAILNWKTFNVGKKTTLTFDQSKGGKAVRQWVAINKVNDPSDVPSQILGSINAEGQVYVLNQNGILFGGSSQVNTHTLVASSLPINDNLVTRGLLNNPDAQFLFSALEVPALQNNATMPAFTPPAPPNTSDGRIGDVVVQKGAQITSPASADKVGGRVALVGPNVRNEGTISTPDGQTILAAGLQVGFTSHATSDPSLRGLDVHVGKVRAPAPAATPENPNPAQPPLYAGTATNAGLIDAPRASVALAGKTVEQLGVVQSSTSVAVNGRIDLLASYNTANLFVIDEARFVPGATGAVTLGPGSVTTILPELFSDETIAGTKLPLLSQVNIEGRTIHLGNDAQILAPNANVTLRAGAWAPFNGATAFISSGGQIHLDSGAGINVAGTPDALAAMAQNILTLELRGAELADSPTQRDGILRGLTLSLDIRETGIFNGLSWAGTPLGDVTGFANLIKRNAAQLTTAGGRVTMSAGDSVVMHPGSLVDVSGGWTNFAGGFVETTRVVSGGRIYDISNATPDLQYTGVYRAENSTTFAKWGVTETFAHPLGLGGRHWEDGYTQGANAGRISITAPAMALDGTLRGLTVAGPRQRTDGPEAGALSLTFTAQDASHPLYLPFAPTPPNIVFQNAPALAEAAQFAVDENGDPLPLRADRLAKVEWSPSLLTKGGFGSLTVANPGGDISVPAGVVLNASAQGSITLSAANIGIAGEIIAPGGSISLTAFNIAPGVFLRLKAQTAPPPLTPPPNPNRGVVSLAPGAKLSTAGLVVDERHGRGAELPLALDGGGISITAYDVALAKGGTLDVSGGVHVDGKGRKHWGDGGGIGIKAGQDPNILSVTGGTLGLGATLRGFAGNSHAGTLAIQAPLIQIGGAATHPDALLLGPAFFSAGGFGDFTLTGLGIATGIAGEFLPGVLVAPGITLAPVAQSVIAQPNGGPDGGAVLVPFAKPRGDRPPVSLHFNAPGVADTFSSAAIIRGDVVLGNGATIRTDPLGEVSLKGNTVTVLGSVLAPGGKITIAGGNNSTNIFAEQSEALSTVFVGSRAVLSARGTTLLTPNPFGHRTGAVLPGGSISIAGNITASAGALLDVSGATDVLDFAPAYVGAGGRTVVTGNRGLTAMPFGQDVVPLRVDSDGGSITLAGGQSLQSDATLRGVAGGRNALGGSLTISSGRFYPPAGGSAPTPLDITLQVAQTGVVAPGANGIGGMLPGFGQFTAGRFAAGGFDSLALKGTVEFTGPVSITARRELLVANGGVLYADSDVQLAAPYARLGTPFITPVLPEQQLPPFTDGGVPFNFKPASGTGGITVRAALLDIGNLSLQNIANAEFIANGGDIRGVGTLDIAGDLTLRAAQIYPPSALTFTIAASEKNIAIATSAQGRREVTLASAVLPPGFGIGSPLLGSTVAAISGATVTLADGANASIGAKTVVTYAPGSGSVRIVGAGTRQLPLSAGGQLNVFGATIGQGGTLVAPLGGITLGWDGTGAAPKDAITGENVAVTRQLTLAPGSLTSVSAISPVDGRAITIPFGLNLNDVSWIDPRGIDITGGGAPQKAVNISAVNVDSQAGSVIDIRGGGDLYAYRWVKSVGGSRDILASETSFAVLPDFAANFAPYAPFNSASLGGDPGYVNGALHVGDRVHLGASDGLPAGVYTLLPARYALLGGAFLVTPKSGPPAGTVKFGDGSSVVSGHRFNDLNPGHAGDALNARFEVAPAATFRARAQYSDYFAGAYLLQGAQRLETPVPRLPGDAGHLVLQAAQSMTLAGRVAAQATGTFRSGLVDITSNADIAINNGGGADALTLNVAQLNSFGAESLLIGGIRAPGAAGTKVTVRSSAVTLDNAGTPLRGPEIILVANEKLALADGAVVEQSGRINGGGLADTLLPGDANVAGSGDGVLLRVGSDPSAGIVRSGLSGSTVPAMIVGSGARLTGASVTLDSTAATSLHPLAILNGEAISLNSGQVSLQLDNAGALPPTTGLVLGGAVLDGLRSAKRLSLLSYTSLDVYGTGSFGVAGALELHAGEIRGFNNGGGTVGIHAGALLLDNAANATVPGAVSAPGGTLEFTAGGIRIGAGQLRIDQFENVALNASGGVFLEGTGGLNVQRNLTATTPSVAAAKAATQSIATGGRLEILAPAGGAGAPATAGLGASLALEGASVRADTSITLPSGVLTLHATAGDVRVNGKLDAGGTSQTFYDITRYTNAGGIALRSDTGSVTLGADSVLNVAAAGAGEAGRVDISAPLGTFTLAGAVRGQASQNGRGGGFSLDIGSLPTLDALAPVLAAGGFSREQSFRVRTGDVVIGGTSKAQTFNLSADLGGITVTGTIDASGTRGGGIALAAGGGLALAPGSRLTVAAREFDAAGKGGAVSLETRGLNGGQIDLQAGSTIDLSVTAKTAASAAAGKFSGTLHLRAPQNATGTDLLLAGLGGTIAGASRIVVEGYRVLDLTGSGLITSAVQEDVFANGTIFGGGATASRLLAGNAALAAVLVVTPGAEIINTTGNLTLGASNSTTAGDWNLAGFRFGPKNAAGALTLRAAGNLVFFNALSDGFATSAYNSELLAFNPLLPANAQSWSYRLTAGADLSAADVSRVQSLAGLAPGTGSLLLGRNAGAASSSSPGAGAQTAAVIGNRYQVIRTGSGDIGVAAGRDVQLLNPFATIYTAGTQVADPTLGGAFDLPNLIPAPQPSLSTPLLGAPQQNPPYPAQFTLAGGNVSIAAQGDIAHYTRNSLGQIVADSSRELPMNWLNRRGFVNQDTGEFGMAGGLGRAGEIASTAWWVDFSNFFQGVGALGGGNVTLAAGRDVSNVDAVIPTNARMPKGAPNAGALVELGGGDLVVRAGRDLDAGVYYVERGHGTLAAGGSIRTNETRSPSLTNLDESAPLAPETWLPTTLFVGKGGFDAGARGEVLLGPVANPFLLPGGYNNTVWYKTYFSTYATDSFVNVSSLAGAVTLRASSAPNGNTAEPLLLTWLQNVLAFDTNSASFFQPWLRLNESGVGPFSTVAALSPGTLRATAFSGDVNVVGKLTLSPSATGTVEIAAAGSLNGLQRNGSASLADTTATTWGSASINLSDTNPALVPGAASPFAYQTLVGTSPGLSLTTGANVLDTVNALFDESGAIRGPDVTLTSKQALHAPGPLHAGDAEPVRLLAGSGNISGVTLFSGKTARVIAGNDISDIALYVQNVAATDVTLVAAGRDILAYNANTPLRVTARSAGNILNIGDEALAGDIQLAGPGTLEVLAGRNLDLGIGPGNTDGTGVGIVTVGNARNPALPFDGAGIIAGAGIGPATGLTGGAVDFATFTDKVLTEKALARYLPELNLPDARTAADFANLPDERRNQVALGIFYLVLRDAGRDANKPGGGYDAGFAAVDALFSKTKSGGDISLTSRAIKTQSGGGVSLFAPGGKLAVGFDVAGAQAIDQGILTEAGGSISIFTNGNVDVGTSRIFTLRGGNIIIWSSAGDIAAGAAAKTVQAAPPTRVIIDPQSADVATDLAGLATGGGIGVLATVANVPPGDVDLIAPRGKIDAGDAGIRSAGNLNVAAPQILNAENIQVTGTSAGTPPAPTVAAPNLGALTAAQTATGSTAQTAGDFTRSTTQTQQQPKEEDPSIVTVEVLGYGGGE
jgi:filamentous hemagglutinin family protein